MIGSPSLLWLGSQQNNTGNIKEIVQFCRYASLYGKKLREIGYRKIIVYLEQGSVLSHLVSLLLWLGSQQNSKGNIKMIV